jgi:hypothetical protein
MIGALVSLEDIENGGLNNSTTSYFVEEPR